MGTPPTLFEQDALQQRVLVAQHETLVGGVPVGRLQVVQVLLVDLDRLLELLDVLGAALAEGGLGLAVPLLPLLRGGVDLYPVLVTTVTHSGRESIVGVLEGFEPKAGRRFDRWTEPPYRSRALDFQIPTTLHLDAGVHEAAYRLSAPLSLGLLGPRRGAGGGDGRLFVLGAGSHGFLAVLLGRGDFLIDRHDIGHTSLPSSELDGQRARGRGLRRAVGFVQWLLRELR